MNERKYGNKSVVLFFALTVALSAVAETLIIVKKMEIMYAVLMWIPAVAALIACCVSFRETGRSFSLRTLASGLGFAKCKLRYIFMGCLLPLIYLLVPYLIFWLLYPQSLVTYGQSVVSTLIGITFSLIVGVLLSMITALGEEIGWRGFMVPALFERLGLEKALGISSLIWCCWHLPLLAFGDYMSGTPLWYQIPTFILCIFPVGIMAGLLAIESGSVWPAAFLHAAHNNYDQAVFGAITVADNKMYFVSETGILTIVCAWALAILMYLRVKKRAAEKQAK